MACKTCARRAHRALAPLAAWRPTRLMCQRSQLHFYTPKPLALKHFSIPGLFCQTANLHAGSLSAVFLSTRSKPALCRAAGEPFVFKGLSTLICDALGLIIYLGFNCARPRRVSKVGVP